MRVLKADDAFFAGARRQAIARMGLVIVNAGPSIERLEKKGVAMASTPSEGNVKEATVDRTKAGGWRMFYEHAAIALSLIGNSAAYHLVVSTPIQTSFAMSMARLMSLLCVLLFLASSEKRLPTR